MPGGQAVKDKDLTEDSLRSDDSKIALFTGLPTYLVLKTVFDFISPYIQEHHRSALSNFQQFIMVLMKLLIWSGFRL